MYYKFLCFCVGVILSSNILAQNNFLGVILKKPSGEQIAFDSLLKQSTPIIISFWATWCSPCITELDNINEELEAWKKETGLQLYAVTIDDARSQASAIGLSKGKGWDLDILFDENQDLKRALNVANIPHIFIFYKGKIKYQQAGYTAGAEKKLIAAVKKMIL